jgi:hypothetical protein
MMADERDQAAIELHQALSDANDADLQPTYDEAARLFWRDDDGPRLVAAVPQRFRKDVIDRLRRARRPVLVEALGRAALAEDGADATVLAWVLEAALQRGDADDLAPLARRLAASDPGAAAQLQAARALTAAGEADEGRALLESAFGGARGGVSVELAAALVDQALADGDFGRATKVIEIALARAVEAPHKARLHRLRATVEERAGHPNRAALERAEAARLDRH